MVLPMELVTVKGEGEGEGEVVIGCFVETLSIEERSVAGGGFLCNLVDNWSGEKKCWRGFGWIVPWVFQCSPEGFQEGDI